MRGSTQDFSRKTNDNTRISETNTNKTLFKHRSGFVTSSTVQWCLRTMQGAVNTLTVARPHPRNRGEAKGERERGGVIENDGESKRNSGEERTCMINRRQM
jgi:hypothetical protein